MHTVHVLHGQDADADGTGSKRSILWFKRWLDEQGHDPVVFWHKVGDVVTKTILLVCAFPDLRVE